MKNLDNSFFLEGERIKVQAVFFLQPDGTISVGEFDTPHESLYNEIKRVILNYQGYIKPAFLGPKPVQFPQNLPVNVVYGK